MIMPSIYNSLNILFSIQRVTRTRKAHRQAIVEKHELDEEESTDEDLEIKTAVKRIIAKARK
jgi:hypothetical protein